MKELQDYSGEFLPDLRLQDFSKDALIQLWHAGGRLYVGIIGFWFRLVRERFGEEAAKELQGSVWMGGGGNELELRRVRDAMNIHGDTVADLFKHFQVDPGAAGFIDFAYDLKSKYHGIATCRRCWALDYFEWSGESTYGEHICDLDVWGFAEAGEIFNTKMKTTCLKLPPRQSKDEIACQWEFQMDPGNSHVKPVNVGGPGLINPATGELEDYSGEFKLDLQMTEFSKDALARICRASGMLYVGLGGIYYSWAKTKWGEDVAAELEAEVWRRAAYLDVRRAKEVMNIDGDDVATVFKVYQVDPGVIGKLDATYRLEGRNHGIMTVNKCRSLAYFARHQEDFRQKNVCEVVDVEGFANTARLIHPNITATPLKLPPRKNRDDIACQWEFKIAD